MNLIADYPSKLYKYQPYNENSLNNLKNHRIWFSKPASFNDPFDCSINFVFENISDIQWKDLYNELKTIWEKNDNQDFKNSYENYFKGGLPSNELKLGFSEAVSLIIRKEREQKIQQLGIACFSEKADEILMWSHYADGHRWFCLEFDTNLDPFDKALPVKYSETLPVLNPKDKSFHPLWILATTKSIGWAYEKEWRLFHEEGSKKFGVAASSLRGVYLGCAMPIEHKKIISQIFLDLPTKIYESRISKTKFEVMFQAIN